MPPELRGLAVGGPVEPWADLGLVVGADGTITVDGVVLRFGAEGTGIRGWTLAGADLGELADLDGLTTAATAEPPAPAGEAHPLGVTAIDHVVALTGDLERTAAVLARAGLDHRRTREAGDAFHQAFFLVRPTLLELGGPAPGHDAAAFWGLTLVVEDLGAAAERLGHRLGPTKDAVQPGRRIATVRDDAGLGVPVALMTPRD